MNVAPTKTTYLRDLCLMYQEASFYATSIPRSCEKAAVKYFQMKKQEKVIAYLDTSLIGFYGKRGFYLTTDGLYWKCWRKKKGSISWNEFQQLTSISLRGEQIICFNDKEIFHLNENAYSAKKLVDLLQKIQQLLCHHSHEFMCREHTYPSISLEELTSICASFQENNPLLKAEQVLATTDQLGTEMTKEIKNRLPVAKTNHIVAHLSTYPHQKTEGITICAEGIYFSKSFTTLYYPWNLFRYVPISVGAEELRVANKYSLSLNHAFMSSGEVMSFLKQIKRHIHKTYEKDNTRKIDKQTLSLFV